MVEIPPKDQINLQQVSRSSNILISLTTHTVQSPTQTLPNTFRHSLCLSTDVGLLNV